MQYMQMQFMNVLTNADSRTSCQHYPLSTNLLFHCTIQRVSKSSFLSYEDASSCLYRGLCRRTVQILAFCHCQFNVFISSVNWRRSEWRLMVGLVSLRIPRVTLLLSGARTGSSTTICGLKMLWLPVCLTKWHSRWSVFPEVPGFHRPPRQTECEVNRFTVWGQRVSLR